MNKKTSIAALIESLLFYATNKLFLSDEDALLARNNLLALFLLDEPEEESNVLAELQSEILTPLVDLAIEAGLAKAEERLLLKAK